LGNGAEEQTGEPLVAGSGVEELSATGLSLKSNTTGGSAWGKPGSPIQPLHRTGSPMGGPHGRGHGSPYRGRGHYGRGGYHGGRGYNRNYVSRGQGGQGHHGGGIRDGPHTGFIRMRGLPFQATKEDVSEFFKEYKPIPDSVILTYRMDGRSTGEAYVAFETPDNAKDAMELHRSTIGSRYIELFISNKEEHTRNVARSTPR
jgi:heterogeneous nuclear ribonucleoprotein F/H